MQKQKTQQTRAQIEPYRRVGRQTALRDIELVDLGVKSEVPYYDGSRPNTGSSTVNDNGDVTTKNTVFPRILFREL